MSRGLREHLIFRAHLYLGRGEPIPLDLFSEMLSAGLDVEEIERKFANQQN